MNATIVVGKKSEIWPRLAKVITRELEINESTVIPKANFLKDLGVSSLGMVALITALELEFLDLGLEILPNDVETLQTVGDFAEYIKRSAV